MADQLAHALLEKMAEKYRKEGYEVVTSPHKQELGDLSDAGIDLIARRGKEVVAVQAKNRHDLYDVQDIEALAKRVESRPGWRFDVIVIPPEDYREIPQNGAELGTEQIRSLLEEAQTGLATGTLRASFLIGWTALEAAMREAAKREGIVIDRETPQFLLKTLYSNGLVSRRDYDRGQRFLEVRNALAHGFDAPQFDVADVRFVLDLAGRLTKVAA
jgi:Holliday junction resolvase-like predicted endonuclease